MSPAPESFGLNFLCVCGGASAVIDSRGTSQAIRRRRRCKKCGAKWTTYERIEGAEPVPAAALGQLQTRIRNLRAQLDSMDVIISDQASMVEITTEVGK